MTQEDFRTSIPSRALEVWRRLYTRYNLEPGPATVGPDVLKTIIPVTQADQLLARHLGVVEDTSLTAVAAGVVVHTVPVGLRRTIYTMRFHRLSGGTWTIDLISLLDVSEGASVSIIPQAASDNVFAASWSAPLVAEAGDQVTVDVATHSVTGDGRLEMWVMDELLF